MLNRPRFTKGALLIEALIATTILAIGVVSALRVFSGSLSVSNRSIKANEVHKILDQKLLGWYLDPVSFDPSMLQLFSAEGEKSNLAARISAEKLTPLAPEEEDEKERQENPQPPRNPVKKTVEFYKVSFQVVDARQRSFFQDVFYMAQYGNQKKS